MESPDQSGAARVVLDAARRRAGETGHEHVEAGHVLLSILEHDARLAERVLAPAGLAPRRLAAALEAALGEGKAPPDPARHPPPSAEVRALVEEAAELAGETELRPAHLLVALLGLEGSLPVRILQSFGVEPDRVRDLCLALLLGEEEEDEGGPAPGVEDEQPIVPGDSVLARIGRDLVSAARSGLLDPVVGREREIAAVLETLVRRRKNNPVLVGEPGVGKSAIVEGVATCIAEGRLPERLKALRIFEISPADLVAGTQYRGEFEARVQKLVEETSANPSIVLFIDEIHTILSAGGPQGTGDAASLLKPHLARGTVRVIGATTTDEYRRFIEKDKALARRFQPISVPEPTPDEAVAILGGWKEKLEEHHGLRVTDEAIAAAVRLTVRHVPERCLPDKAIDVLDQTCARKSLAQEGEKGAVTAADVAERLRDMLGKDLGAVSLEDAERLLGLEEFLRSRVIGQDHVAERIADRLRLTRRRLDFRPERPAGVFLLLGPTGVGKTETARALAEYFHGSPSKLIRLDLSEFSEAHTVSRIVGAPPGYVGYEEEGHQLTSRIRSHPRAVLLLDEIEKAHPAVLNLFLQVFDDGRLTDAQGRTVSFSEVTILLTTNLGQEAFAPGEAIGFSRGGAADPDELKERALSELRGRLPPELLNRMDEVLVFQPLGDQALAAIARMLVERVVRRFAREGKKIVVDESVVRHLVETGYDPRYGARHLARNVERELLQPLARETYLSGWDRVTEVRVTKRGRALVFEKVTAERPVRPLGALGAFGPPPDPGGDRAGRA